MLTDVGRWSTLCPDRNGSCEPRIVARLQAHLTGVDEMGISLSAKGLTTGEMSPHLAGVHGAEVSRQTISTITDKVVGGMAKWRNRPLESSTRRSSSTLSTSRSATAKSLAGRSLSRWRRAVRAAATCRTHMRLPRRDELDPTGVRRARWMLRLKPALNTFEIAFDGRLTARRK